MKHVCPFNVSNIELYLYIIYMLISFLYPYRPTSMCYTQVLYSNIYIAFFLWEKKIIKWFLLNECCLFWWGKGGTGGVWLTGGGSAPAWLQQWGCSRGTPSFVPPGLLWWHPYPLVTQAFERRVTWLWIMTEDMMGSVATAPRGSSYPSPSLQGSGPCCPVLEDLESQTQVEFHHPSPSPAGIHSPFSSPGLICFSPSLPLGTVGERAVR